MIIVALGIPADMPVVGHIVLSDMAFC